MRCFWTTAFTPLLCLLLHADFAVARSASTAGEPRSVCTRSAEDSLAIEEAQVSVQLAQSREERCEALMSLAQAQQDFYKYEEANATAVKALEIADSINSPHILAKAHFLLGDCMRRQGFLHEAREPISKAVELYRGTEYKKEHAEALRVFGIIEKNIGNLDKAMAHYFSSLELYTDIDDQGGIASAYSAIGVVYRHQGDFDQGLEYLDKSLAIRQKQDDQYGIAGCYSNKGVILKLQGHYRKALDQYFLSLKISRQHGFMAYESYTLHNIGGVYILLNKPEDALEYLKASEIIKQEIKDYLGLSSTRELLGDVYLSRGDMDTAKFYLELAQKDALSVGSLSVLEVSYASLINLYIRLNDNDKALESWESYIQIKDSLDQSKATRAIYELQTEYDVKREKALAELEQKENALTNANQDLQQRLKREQTYERWLFIAVLSLISILAITLYTRFRSLRKSREKLEIANQELQRTMLSKEEKEVLLKEVHHRVKNNMQIIMSLLRLQSSGIDDEHVQILYAESQNRIKSMALVHEELYQAKDLTNVDVKDYLEKLVDNLILTYSIGPKITTESKIAVTHLGVDTLVPLGLLLNEIISNSFKHAFKETTDAKIYVELHRPFSNRQLELKIGDNGLGFYKKNTESDSLGFELIESLVEQLDGEMKVESSSGVHYEIVFLEQAR